MSERSISMSGPVEASHGKSHGQTRQGWWRRQAIRAAFWLALVAITALALTPGPSLPPALLGADKLKHAAAFAALAGLARLGWPGVRLWLLALVLLLHGGLIEIVQAMPVLGRDMSLADLAADAIGIALGFAAVWSWKRMRRV